MLQLEQHTAPIARRGLSLSLARHEDEVKAAQTLRYKVFAEEMGAQLPSAGLGLDVDLYDAFCEHLLVKDVQTGEVVGTYRILPPAQAKRLGCYYSDSEFDLTRLQHIRANLVEVGRSCVHPDYRNGATIALLWQGLIDYMTQSGHRYLAGCASIGMADGGHAAASIYRQLWQQAQAPIEWRVTPRCRLPLEALDLRQEAEITPLIRAYIRAGALICGEPAWDPDFNTADLFVLLPLARMSSRHARHFKQTGRAS